MKRFVLASLIFTMAISLFACSDKLENESELTNLPTLEVSYGDGIIDAERGTASWTTTDSSGDNVTVDSDSEKPVELVKDMVPLEASPNSNLELYFYNSQPDEVRAYIWEGDNQLEQPVTSMEITTPEMEGLVIYEVVATWEQGIVHYAFSINVK